MKFKIDHKQADKEGSFTVETEDGEMGHLNYEINRNGYMALLHTEVDESMKGSGASVALLDAAADYARLHKHKILTVCSFARIYMHDKHPAKYQDVLV